MIAPCRHNNWNFYFRYDGCADCKIKFRMGFTFGTERFVISEESRQNEQYIFEQLRQEGLL